MSIVRELNEAAQNVEEIMVNHPEDERGGAAFLREELPSLLRKASALLATYSYTTSAGPEAYG